jgi:hypothetical protein
MMKGIHHKIHNMTKDTKRYLYFCVFCHVVNFVVNAFLFT